MENVLNVHGAEKRFGSTQALAGAGLELRQGELLALLGPNGAGKTTLVRAIAGRVRLDAGEMELLGKSLSPSSPKIERRRPLGVVPQEIALYPELTARENLSAFGSLLGMDPPTIAERSKWLLDWVGLEERADDLTKTYSGGMKRRLNIACSVIHRPQVLLLDEPTAGVDPQSRHRIWEMLNELRSDGASLLLTTHLLDEAQQVCDRIIIIDQGKTIASGTFDELARDTIGLDRRVILSLAGEVPASLQDSHWDEAQQLWTDRVDDVAVELPQLLDKITTAGATIGDIRIESPTLQSVFIHLTGRELRD